MTTKEQLVEKTMKDMLETLSGVEKYVLVEKIVDLQQRIDKAIAYIKKEFTNEDGTCWHEEMKYILDILRGDE